MARVLFAITYSPAQLLAHIVLYTRGGHAKVSRVIEQKLLTVLGGGEV
jgi:hypothetical protein